MIQYEKSQKICIIIYEGSRSLNKMKMGHPYCLRTDATVNVLDLVSAVEVAHDFYRRPRILLYPES